MTQAVHKGTNIYVNQPEVALLSELIGTFLAHSDGSQDPKVQQQIQAAESLQDKLGIW